MSTQLDLITGQPVSPPRDPDALTGRQQLALAHIAAHQPVSSDELGALLHEDRMRRGLKGHGRDERCTFCAGEGREMGETLRRRGLIIRKRTVGWCLPDWQPTPEPSTQNRDGIPY